MIITRLAKIVSTVFLMLVTVSCSTMAEGFALKPIQQVQGTAGYDWLQFNGNPEHTGNNTQETILDTQSITALRQLFQVYLPDKVYQSPVYLRNVHTSRGVLNLLFVTTSSGSILAMDASNGNFIWERKFGSENCTIDQSTQNCYTASIPVIDPNLQYVYSYGVDGKVHKLQVMDGKEITGGGWPEAATINPAEETSNSALSIASTPDGKKYLYVATTGYPESKGNFQGHLTTINLLDGTQNVFNTACSDQSSHLPVDSSARCSNSQSGITQPSGVVYDPDTNRIFISTGRGTYDPAHFSWADSILALNPYGSSTSGMPVDSIPSMGNPAQKPGDINQASAAFAILPASKSLNTPALGVMVGTDGMMSLVDLSDMRGKGSLGTSGSEIGKPVALPQGGNTNNQPTVWVSPIDQTPWIFISNAAGLSAFQLQKTGTDNPTLIQKWSVDEGGTSPIIAADTLYYSAAGVVRAVNPISGKVLWLDNSVGQIKMNTPIVANGILYVVDWDNHLTAYSLNGELP